MPSSTLRVERSSNKHNSYQFFLTGNAERCVKAFPNGVWERDKAEVGNEKKMEFGNEIQANHKYNGSGELTDWCVDVLGFMPSTTINQYSLVQDD